MRTAGAFPGAGRGKVPTQKGSTLPAEILTPEEILAILDECRHATTGIRDRALITVMYRSWLRAPGSGLRVSEALSLQPKDVDLHIGAIAVLHGKGDRRRTVGIDPGASPVVEHWVSVRQDRLAPPLGVPIFCSQKCRRMSKSMVREMLVRNAARAGIEKRVHPHGLRHTMAYELLMEGVPIPVTSPLSWSCGATPKERRRRSPLPPKQVLEVMSDRNWTAPSG
jgi:site-specific recombinase XerD